MNISPLDVRSSASRINRRFLISLALLLVSSTALAAERRAADGTILPPLTSALSQGAALPTATLETKFARLLHRGKVKSNLLATAKDNVHVKPYWARTLLALEKVEGLPGVNEVLQRLSRSGEESNARGAAFEVIAGAALGTKLKRLSTMVKGNECDGLLKDGTVVSMKSIASLSKNAVKRTMRHATKQLTRRTVDGNHAMIVVGHEPQVKVEYNWACMAKTIGAPLTVLALNHKTGALKQLFSGTGPSNNSKVQSKLYTTRPAPPKVRNLLKDRARVRGLRTLSPTQGRAF